MKKLLLSIKKQKVVVSLIEFLDLVNENNLSQLSAQGAYFIFASLVPFLILLLTLLRFSPFDFKCATKLITESVPEYFRSFSLDIISQIYKNADFAFSLSIITLLWTSSKGIYVLIDGFNIINKTRKKTTYFKNLFFSSLYTLMFIIFFPLLVLITVFGQSIITLLIDFLPVLNKVKLLIFFSKFIISTLVIFAVLCFIYKFFSNIKFKFKEVIFGSLFSTLVWQIFSFLFGMYVDFSLKNANIYGSMSIILILLFWLYWLYFIIFVGAQINYFLHYRKQ